MGSNAEDDYSTTEQYRQLKKLLPKQYPLGFRISQTKQRIQPWRGHESNSGLHHWR